MTYTWKQLVDRCLVSIDASRVALTKFLQEAEVELTRKVNILESSYVDNSCSTSRLTLPPQFKEITAVYIDGILAKKMDLIELELDNSNSVRSGTPNRYTVETGHIAGTPVNYILFDKTPSNVKIKIYYYALSIKPDVNQGPIIPRQFQPDLCLYANHMATRKLSPELSTQYLQEWMLAIENIKGEDADRDMIYQIKEEI
ncbi:MAG: hypothetical protein Unbinned5336contig1001_24 [Prokaryotic dsDNA virus sp.]|nr:MAG: hypothetical protein Unbinned5336contig1001_24 [Prokaryotic dsDNA virus sp.]|tara:strand:- start:132 stop:731 length:600 start_codon:yes stop_codon:yes gene_type:complete